MKKTMISCGVILMLFSMIAKAQQPIDQLIESEKKFAATSEKQTTKQAFLAYVDSNCIGFNNGKQLNVFKEWTERIEDQSKLTWAPELAIIASSGEIGVTAGPWEYREKSLKDTALAHGHFTTVWKKKDNGEWKAVMDMGISYAQKIINNPATKKIILNSEKNNINDSTGLMQTDKNFIEAYKKNKTVALQNVIEKDSWISVNGHYPLKDANAIQSMSDNIPAKITFSPLGLFVSANLDLLIVYGTAESDDGKKQSYMRVWKRSKNNWKLQLMVLS